MTIEKPSPTESFVHQMLGTLVEHDITTHNLRSQVSHEVEHSPPMGRVHALADSAPGLDEAVARMIAFRATWNEGDQIDVESGLTADDIDTILSFVADFPSSG